MKKINLTFLFLIIVGLFVSGCTKTVYVEPNVCPQKCVTAFYEDKGTCREHLESLNRQGVVMGFDPVDFQCDNSYERNSQCECNCHCGLGYQFSLSK